MKQSTFNDGTRFASTRMESDPRLSIARLAAAVMAADARVSNTEIASLRGLVRLGLGTLEDVTRDQLLRSSEEPIDVPAACGELVGRYPDAGATILAALAEIAASDGELDPRELALLARIVGPEFAVLAVRRLAAATAAYTAVVAQQEGV